MIRLRYAVAAAMLTFFASAVLAWWLPYDLMLPIMAVSLFGWAVLGSAARNYREQG